MGTKNLYIDVINGTFIGNWNNLVEKGQRVLNSKKGLNGHKKNV